MKLSLLLLIGIVLSAGCVQQLNQPVNVNQLLQQPATLIGGQTYLPCSSPAECQRFMKSTGMPADRLNQAMSSLVCQNNQCYLQQ